MARWNRRPTANVVDSDRGSQGDLNRSSQHLDHGGVDGQANRLDDNLDGSAGDEVAGRPPLRRDIERAFWAKIAEGTTSEDAAVACGVSGPVGSRWFRERGGMASISLDPPSGRYLSFAEREEIALLRAKNLGVRAIARELDRDPSTISREIRRNAATRGGKLEYRASIAQWKAELLAKRPKTAKLVANQRLRDYIQDRLAGVIRRHGWHRGHRAGSAGVERAQQAAAG